MFRIIFTIILIPIIMVSEWSLAEVACPEFDAMKSESFNKCSPQTAGTCGFNSLSNIIELSFTPEVYGILSRSSISNENDLKLLSSDQGSFYEGISNEILGEVDSFGAKYGYCDLESELNIIKKQFTYPHGLGGCNTNHKIIDAIILAIKNKTVEDLSSDLLEPIIRPSEQLVMRSDHHPQSINSKNSCSSLVLGELMRLVYADKKYPSDSNTSVANSHLKQKLKENLTPPVEFANTTLYKSKDRNISQNASVHSFFYNLCKSGKKFQTSQYTYTVTPVNKIRGNTGDGIIDYFSRCKNNQGCDCSGIHVASNSSLSGHAFAIKGITRVKDGTCRMIVYDSNVCRFNDFFKQFASSGTGQKSNSFYDFISNKADLVSSESIPSGCKYTLPVKALNLNKTLLYGYCKKIKLSKISIPVSSGKSAVKKN